MKFLLFVGEIVFWQFLLRGLNCWFFWFFGCFRFQWIGKSSLVCNGKITLVFETIRSLRVIDLSEIKFYLTRVLELFIYYNVQGCQSMVSATSYWESKKFVLLGLSKLSYFFFFLF